MWPTAVARKIHFANDALSSAFGSEEEREQELIRAGAEAGIRFVFEGAGGR